VWDRNLAAVTTAYDGDVQMIYSTSVRVHQRAANSNRFARRQTIYFLLLLALLDPLLAEGALLQLSGQVGGSAILLVSFFLLTEPWEDRGIRAALGRAGGCALVFAALLICYPVNGPRNLLTLGRVIFLTWRGW
jgi:hypothetical protein